MEPERRKFCHSCEALAIKVAELEKRIQMIREFQEKAVYLASQELSKRLEHSNGLIDMLKQQAALFITRQEVWLVVSATTGVALAFVALVRFFGGR